MEIIASLNIIVALLFLAGVAVTLKVGIKVVPQSDVYVVERFGKYSRTLNAGLSVIIPFVDKVAHRLSILERQLQPQTISVITQDNVEVNLDTIVFFRIVDASKTVYRINDIESALKTASSSIVRSAAGKLELDDLQSSRDSMNTEIETNLFSAAEVWGIDITRTEITDVIVDDSTKDAQRQQLNAERKRRATIADAEGEKRATELLADAELYKAEREAEAIKLTADAVAYETKVKAEADAAQTRLLAEAIAEDGMSAVNFEIAKRQVEAMATLAASENAKSLVLPTDVTQSLGVAAAFIETLKQQPAGS